MSLAEETDRVPQAELGPEHEVFLRDVLRGLHEPQRTLPSKYFYDHRGLDLFNAISGTPEYYLARSERQIMTRRSDDISSAIGPRAVLIEYGSAATDKARRLLASLREPAGYQAIDISRQHLEKGLEELALDFPNLEISGLCADFTQPFSLPRVEAAHDRRAIYFAGSTIGNFEAEAADRLVAGMRDHLRVGDGLLIGIDLQKDVEVLLRAYNDRQGHTEAFNRNILVHINRVLGADFAPQSFMHRAIYNSQLQRIEMYLVSSQEQSVRIGGDDIRLEAGATILTEYSHKYDVDQFAERLDGIGFSLRQSWTDDRRYFAVLFFLAV